MRKLLRKLLSLSLCAALVGGTAAALPIFVPDSGITASAVETNGDFQYTVSDNTVNITGYNGTKKMLLFHQ